MTRDILLSDIKPDPNQPRKYFDPERLAELAASINEHGLAVPILVRPNGNGYIIVHGERRYKAVQSMGWEAIPAEVRDIPADQARWLSLIENIQREDLSPMEEAVEYSRILESGIKQAELGKRIGKSQSYIAQKMRLFNMPAPLQFLIQHKMITEGHARQLLKLDNFYQDATSNLEWMVEAENKITISGQALAVFLQPLEWPLGVDTVGKFDDNNQIEQVEGMIWLASYLEKDRLNPGAIDLFDNLAKSFMQWLKDEGPIVQSWIPAAVWFGMLAYYKTLPVVTLDKLIDLFQHLIYSAIFKTTNWLPPKKGKGDDDMELLRWIGYIQDLTNAGIDNEQADIMQEKSIHYILDNHGLLMPTSMQPYCPMYIGINADASDRRNFEKMTAYSGGGVNKEGILYTTFKEYKPRMRWIRERKLLTE